MMLRALHYACIVSFVALIFLTLAWEAWLAPTGRVVLILKTLPLLLPLFGILRGKRYTYQWSSMLILLYFTEGVVRAYSETGIAARLALAEVALAVVFYLCAISYARLTRPQ
jgi:uncharacterized membrane protein